MNPTNLGAKAISSMASKLYVGGSALRKVLVVLRQYIFPFEALLDWVPKDARVLDVGCGDGLFLNSLAESGRIRSGLGFDSNASAIGHALHAAANLSRPQCVDFMALDVGTAWPQERFEVVSMVDVLHHIPPAFKRSAIQEALDHVRPDGHFLYKDMVAKPRWRALANSLHDLVLARQWVSYTPLDTVIEWAVAAGFSVQKRGHWNRYWYGPEGVLLKRSAV